MNNQDLFAGAILISKDGAYVLQLRDDNPDIIDAGKLSLFAGRLQQGESHSDAVKRVLTEEASLDASSLTFFKAFEKDPARHGAAGTTYIYVAKDVDPNLIQVRQGQGYKLVGNLSELSQDNTALISYDILQAYEAAS